jgi:hypothetical protein
VTYTIDGYLDGISKKPWAEIEEELNAAHYESGRHIAAFALGEVAKPSPQDFSKWSLGYARFQKRESGVAA